MQRLIWRKKLCSLFLPKLLIFHLISLPSRKTSASIFMFWYGDNIINDQSLDDRHEDETTTRAGESRLVIQINEYQWYLTCKEINCKCDSIQNRWKCILGMESQIMMTNRLWTFLFMSSLPFMKYQITTNEVSTLNVIFLYWHTDR